MGAALSAALSAVFRFRSMGRFLFRVMRTKLECAAQCRGTRSYAPRFVQFVRSESIVLHRAKKGRGSLLSWNRSSVVLAGVVVLCLLCLPGAVAWAQEETTEAAGVVTDTVTKIDTASDAVAQAAESDTADLDDAATKAEVMEATDGISVDEIEDVDQADQLDEATKIDTAAPDEERMEESDSMFDEESVYYDHVGWYVRGGVFGGFLEGRKGVDFDPGIGFSVAGGLRHNRWMAVEVNYSKVTKAKPMTSDLRTPGPSRNTKWRLIFTSIPWA